MKKFFSILAGTVIAFTATSFAANQPPVNEKCPVCGKDGRLIFHAVVKGERIIFATADCKDKFEKAPAGKYPVKKKS
ncbi:MAG: hypothetical protein K8R87_13935 [Verrucomicrobia bacterium]|nr:hypothetical protein [Verrucomicrobiota bacterium]